MAAAIATGRSHGAFAAQNVTLDPALQAIPGLTIKPEFYPTVVTVKRQFAAGSIHVVSSHHFLYYIVRPGTAIRYGVAVGREGLQFRGAAEVGRKVEWPSWKPTPEMIARNASYARYADGMAGGPKNPLGARALYLGSSLYRIHGTNEPYTIGQNVSSGCIRMMNQDVEDLYDRVRVGTKVIVL